jgi:hypothetical protein
MGSNNQYLSAQPIMSSIGKIEDEFFIDHSTGTIVSIQKCVRGSNYKAGYA